MGSSGATGASRRRSRVAAVLAAAAAGVALATGSSTEDESRESGVAPAAARLQPLSSLAGSGAPPRLEGPAGVRALAERTYDVEGTGRLRTAPGSSAVAGEGSVRRFAIDVESGLPLNRMELVEEIERALFDPRGWTADGGLALQRVDSGEVDFRIAVASPETTDRLCVPHDTHGRLSCAVGNRAVLNAWRWLEGAQPYEGDLAGYRRYLVNHEVGHTLGHAEHLPCPEIGAEAPVMMQQTLGVDACEPSPWPTAAERSRVTR